MQRFEVALERFRALGRGVERRLPFVELRADGAGRRALGLDRPLRFGADGLHQLLTGELRLQARARRRRFGFSRGDTRQLDHERLERLVLSGILERRFERRELGVERGAKAVELAREVGDVTPQRGD